jgi:tight adherence protein B
MDATLPLLIFASVSAAVVGAGLLIYELFFRHRDEVTQRLHEEFGQPRGGSSQQTRLFKDLSKLAVQSSDVAESRGDRLQRAIEQAGLSLSAWQLLSASAAAALCAALLAAAFTTTWWKVAASAMLVFPVPGFFVMVRRDRRLTLLRQQLPDAFEMMSRSIRAGQTVTRSFQTVADDFEAPISDEFAWCFEQQNLGLPHEIALRDLARRCGVAELQMLVVALLVQRQSGGSPVELLDNLASVVRQRIHLQEKIRTLTAEGRMQALVLLLLPPLLLAAISSLNPEYVATLWDRPGLLLGMLGSELLGMLWIRRILSLEF